MLDEAFGTYRKLGERHLAGRALTSKAIVLALDHKPGAAARLFRRALPFLDASRDPQLVTTTRFNLLDALVRADDLHGAVHLLVQTNLREDFATDP
ncbi:MAG TPA: hypothetical protein DD490_35490, partial [Acidobacteria bacterium]|nr:hypothetical protein [Acidobacteriota bacterium]